MADTDVCYCSHTEDEHERNENGFLAACTVEGCDCVYYERDVEDEDDE